MEQWQKHKPDIQVFDSGGGGGGPEPPEENKLGKNIQIPHRKTLH